jgi:hypothetical protein
MGTTLGKRAAHRTIVTAMALLVGLAGCASGEPAPAPSATEAPAPSATTSAPTPGDTDPPEAGAPLESVPVSAACSDLLGPQTVYDYNPNVGTDPGYRPTDAAALAVTWQGVACGLLNQTSGVEFSFAVARFTPESFPRAQGELAAGASEVSGLPGVSYFRSTNGTGRVDVFIDDYWIVGESIAFFQARDAAGLLEGILETLP